MSLTSLRASGGVVKEAFCGMRTSLPHIDELRDHLAENTARSRMP